MKTTLILSVALLMAGPVFAQSAAEKTGINSLVGTAPSTQDFVQEAAMSDMFELQASQLAVERGDPQTIEFARQMIADHQKTSEELKAFVMSGHVKAELPAGVSAKQGKVLAKLKDLQGTEFSKEYRSDQQSAHEDAVDLFKRYAKGGDNPTLKDWAAKTLPALEHHLKLAENLNK